MSTVQIPEAKIILCGDYGVGKTSLFRRFYNDTFTSRRDRQSTLGLDFFSKSFNLTSSSNNEDEEEHLSSLTSTLSHNVQVGGGFNRNAIKLQLWDTGGMERVASVTSSYYKFAEAAILVYAMDDPDTFHACAQHLVEILSYAENAKVFLCGNKMDTMSKKSGASPVKSPDSDVSYKSSFNNEFVTEQDVVNFCEQCGSDLITGMYTTSCQTGEGVHEMFQSIATLIANESSYRSRRELVDLNSASGQASFQLYSDSSEEIQSESTSCCS